MKSPPAPSVSSPRVGWVATAKVSVRPAAPVAELARLPVTLARFAAFGSALQKFDAVTFPAGGGFGTPGGGGVAPSSLLSLPPQPAISAEAAISATAARVDEEPRRDWKRLLELRAIKLNSWGPGGIDAARIGYSGSEPSGRNRVGEREIGT